MKKRRLKNKEKIRISHAKYMKEHYKLYPWKKTYQRIVSRCIYDKNSYYYKRGIKCLITVKELKFLWFRDEAYLMTKPSIDRRNPLGNYVLKNCRYIELELNFSSKPINQYAVRGKFLKTYKSVSEAGRCMGIGYSNIAAVANKYRGRITAKGFTWKWAKN